MQESLKHLIEGKWFIPLNTHEYIYVAKWWFLDSYTSSEVHVLDMNMNLLIQ
jgi:hypothetical protein